MKKLLAVSTLIMMMAVSSGFVVTSANAFWCGSRLVNPGDTRSDVLRKCGPPDWVDSWEEARVERVFGLPYSRWHGGHNWGGSETHFPRGVVIYITVEEWTYNRGPTQFQRILRFENSRLVIVETGDYGY